MRTEQVKKLDPLDRFLYWIRERHQIHLRRKAGKPKPWTDDEVLQRFFFTNPYRENDKVTVWFRENIRDPLKEDPVVFFATVCFRWFNLPSTGEVLMGANKPRFTHEKWSAVDLLREWDSKEALRRLSDIRKREGMGNGSGQVFTGAFMINSPGGEPKLEAIIRRINNVWEKREELLGWFHERLAGEGLEMKNVQSALLNFDGLGGFMAYEVVCDLRYTYLLRDASDKRTWCNPGPGCIRGLYRIKGETWKSKGDNATSPPRPRDWQERMIRLLDYVENRLPKMPPFEMREIEHSLCEFDKYCRALEGDGKMKRTYNGVSN